MAGRSCLAAAAALVAALLLWLFIRSAAQVEDIKNNTHVRSPLMS